MRAGTHTWTPAGGSHTHCPVVRFAYMMFLELGSMISTHSSLQRRTRSINEKFKKMNWGLYIKYTKRLKPVKRTTGNINQVISTWTDKRWPATFTIRTPIRRPDQPLCTHLAERIVFAAKVSGVNCRRSTAIKEEQIKTTWEHNQGTQERKVNWMKTTQKQRGRGWKRHKKPRKLSLDSSYRLKVYYQQH